MNNHLIARIVIYEKQEIPMYLDVNKKELADVYLEDMNVYYTGQYYEVNVSGNLPKDAVVIYPKGNKFKNATQEKCVSHPLLCNKLPQNLAT